MTISDQFIFFLNVLRRSSDCRLRPILIATLAAPHQSAFGQSKAPLALQCDGFSNGVSLGQSNVRTPCQKIISAIKDRPNLWGESLFSEYLELTSKTAAPKGAWILKISVRQKSTLVSLDSPTSLSHHSGFEIASDQKAFESSLANPAIPQLLLARALSESIARAVVSGKELSSGQVVIKANHPVPFPDMKVQKLFVFALTRSPSGMLTPEVVAEANVVHHDENSTSWAITQRAKAKINPELTYFVQSAGGPGDDRSPIDDLIASKLSPNTGLMHLMNSWYIGSRYGRAVNAKDPLTQAHSFLPFAESRSGSANGLRINYDMSPRSTKTDENYDWSFKWSRLQAGYSFGWNLNLPLIDRFDAMPRLGTANYSLVLKPVTEGIDEVNYDAT